MFTSTKIIELGSCAFRQPLANSHCKFLHGYQLTAKFWFSAKHLDQNNWVVDFGGLKGLREIMQDQFDHTTCISRTDPKHMLFKQLRDEGVCDLRIMDGVGIEKFAEWCHTVADNYVDELTDGRCNCIKVEVFEHENNSAMFEIRNSSASGALYMNDKADEIEKSVKEPKKRVKTTIATKEQLKDLTKPPFQKNEKKVEDPPLYRPKQTNTWIDKTGKSTWGL